MRTISFGQAECLGMPVHYELLVEDADGLERYGLRIRYRDETAELPDITISQRGIQLLAKAVTSGCVTPVALRDTVEDWLCR